MTSTPLGAVAGAASIQSPLARLTPAQAATVEAFRTGSVVITPSRGLVLPGAAHRLPELAAAGVRRRSRLALVCYLGVRRRPLLREFFDQHARVRDRIGSFRIAAAADPHQRLRATLRRTNRCSS